MHNFSFDAQLLRAWTVSEKGLSTSFSAVWSRDSGFFSCTHNRSSSTPVSTLYNTYYFLVVPKSCAHKGAMQNQKPFKLINGQASFLINARTAAASVHPSTISHVFAFTVRVLLKLHSLVTISLKAAKDRETAAGSPPKKRPATHLTTVSGRDRGCSHSTVFQRCPEANCQTLLQNMPALPVIEAQPMTPQPPSPSRV
jgi:hypothetical protein